MFVFSLKYYKYVTKEERGVGVKVELRGIAITKLVNIASYPM
jgi:hypothetical protein